EAASLFDQRREPLGQNSSIQRQLDLNRPSLVEIVKQARRDSRPIVQRHGMTSGPPLYANYDKAYPATLPSHFPAPGFAASTFLSTASWCRARCSITPVSRWLRRYEIRLLLWCNDGQPVPDELVVDTLSVNHIPSDASVAGGTEETAARF